MKKIKYAVIYTIYLIVLFAAADIIYTSFFEHIPPLRTEVYLQMSGESIHQKAKDPMLVYELKPYAKDLSRQYYINSRGMRDKELMDENPDLRVLVLGDSITFGPEVKNEELFTEIAENILAEQGERVEILNAGVCGYNTRQEFLALKTKHIDLAPDLVIFAYCTDDATEAAIQYLPDDYVQKEFFIKKGNMPKGPGAMHYRNITPQDYLCMVFPEQSFFPYKLDRWLLKNSGIYRTIAITAFKKQNNIRDAKDIPAFLLVFDYEELLREIKEYARKNEFRVAFMTCPTVRSWDNEAFKKRLENSGIACWDLAGVMAERLKPDENIWEIDPHLNINGHRMFGEVLAESLKQQINYSSGE
ncbi:MAG: GDSL-type esterase/lipase family protein [Candidatus Omnitrophota bacterium]